MSVIPDTGSIDVPDGTSPLYTDDSLPPPNQGIPFGMTVASGSGIDSDTVQGITAVTAIVAGPNKLVATGSNGMLPSSIVPASAGVLPFQSGTYSALKGSPPSKISFCMATDQGVAGALYIYVNNSSAGDAGFILLGSS